MHPCVCHCLDVAAVAQELLRRKPALLDDFAHLLESPKSDAEAVLLFLITLHDIGKLSRTFQSIEPSLYPEAVLGENAPRMSLDPHHGVAGLHLFEALLKKRTDLPFMSWPRSWFIALIAPIVGHHGRPVRTSDTILGSQVFGSGCLDAASRFIDLTQSLFAPPPSLVQPNPDALRRWSWRLCGFVVLADWIGSNQRWFPYYDPEEGLTPTAYIEDRRARAADALRQAGLLLKPISAANDYQALTGQKHKPSPVQAFAEQVPLADGPNLVLIEDMTGSGKTEAALVLAHRMMAAGKGRGLFMALPTMATADALYGRLGGIYRRLFVTGASPSLVLAHGAAKLHPGFTSSVLPVDRAELATEEGHESDRSSAACAAWIADSRKRAFLADVGVGTIDQAFLTVLPAQYQSLRLHGLAERVLIVDEAHAYDSYMGEELERLLQFQAGLGGSAIVLSATLPKTKRQALIDAFASGHDNAVAETTKTDYPLVSVAVSGQLQEEPLATRPDLPRQLTVGRCRNEAAAIQHIQEAVAAGAAVAWVRNSVDDVVDALKRLRAEAVDATMFYARFAMGDRLEVEKDVIRRFGKKSRDRAGMLVATQVIEQSLDLDFDLLVSDLAPIDLLLQRAGRLWRHTRPDRPIAGPKLLVVSPDPVDAPDEDWYEQAFPRGAYVYRDHALLWLTARILFARESWQIPEDVRHLIETVYGGIARDGAVPAGLQTRHNEAIGRANADEGIAGANLLSFAKGYGGAHGGWETDIRTPTRLGDETRTIRLARPIDGVLSPWCAIADDLPRSWALSEVKISVNKIADVIIPDHLKAAAATASAAMRTISCSFH